MPQMALDDGRLVFGVPTLLHVLTESGVEMARGWLFECYLKWRVSLWTVTSGLVQSVSDADWNYFPVLHLRTRNKCPEFVKIVRNPVLV